MVESSGENDCRCQHPVVCRGFDIGYRYLVASYTKSLENSLRISVGRGFRRFGMTCMLQVVCMRCFFVGYGPYRANMVFWMVSDRFL